ncbi:MFS transporter [Microbispora sp. NPDC046933]|uniref:MFS transporter n=1 Tax=Microbispora sp. NPDC046933 TaxID=3155618 RepID=UPI0033EC705E
MRTSAAANVSSVPSVPSVPSWAGWGTCTADGLAGLLMLPGMLAIVPAGAAVGRISASLGPRGPLACGFALFAVGAGLMALGHASYWQHLVFYAVVGAGSGLVMGGALPKLIADIVPLARTGTANGINNIARTVGSVIGSQLAAALIASCRTHRPPPSPRTSRTRTRGRSA